MTRKEILIKAKKLRSLGFDSKRVNDNADSDILLLRNAWNKDVEDVKKKVQTVSAIAVYDFDSTDEVMLTDNLDKHFSQRIVNACDSAGVHTLEELLQYGYPRFFKLKNIGGLSLRQVSEFMKASGLGIAWCEEGVTVEEESR